MTEATKSRPRSRNRERDLPTNDVENVVLTPQECRKALKISRAQWFRIAPKLPVSYALGDRCPRYVWPDVVAYLRTTREP